MGERPFYCEDFLLCYWQPVKASVDTGRVDPATGVTGVACSSFGEQFRVPPEDGTKAIPSMVYEIDGSESAGLGLAAGASQSNATNANAGIRSRPTRRSHDVSFETTMHPDVCYGGLTATER